MHARQCVCEQNLPPFNKQDSGTATNVNRTEARGDQKDWHKNFGHLASWCGKDGSQNIVGRKNVGFANFQDVTVVTFLHCTNGVL